jgi:hypothetical protein
MIPTTHADHHAIPFRFIDSSTSDLHPENLSGKDYGQSEANTQGNRRYQPPRTLLHDEWGLKL